MAAAWQRHVCDSHSQRLHFMVYPDASEVKVFPSTKQLEITSLLNLHTSSAHKPQGNTDRQQDVYHWQLHILLSQPGEAGLRDHSFTI